jgi:hypothetical protein
MTITPVGSVAIRIGVVIPIPIAGTDLDAEAGITSPFVMAITSVNGGLGLPRPTLVLGQDHAGTGDPGGGFHLFSFSATLPSQLGNETRWVPGGHLGIAYAACASSREISLRTKSR